MLQEEKLLSNHALNPPVPNLGTIGDMPVSGESAIEMYGHDSNDFGSGGYSNEKECVVCMDSERNCVLHPCHHLCTCIQCGRLLFKRQDACPICRRTITNVFRVYHS